MSFKDLAPKGPENSGKPLSTIVKDVMWCTPKKGPGLLVFPSSFSGEIATEVATPENLGYYGAKFANRTEERIYVHMEHQQANFSYADNYLDNYVMVDKEKGGAGGASLERHSFCHTDTPYEDQATSGVFVIGKFLDESETQIELTGFVIPQGETLWIPPNVIHTNNYLKGKWNTMLNVDKPIEEVKLVRKGNFSNFCFTFREAERQKETNVEEELVKRANKDGESAKGKLQRLLVKMEKENRERMENILRWEKELLVKKVNEERERIAYCENQLLRLLVKKANEGRERIETIQRWETENYKQY